MEKVQYLIDEFVDYNENRRKFIIAAVSIPENDETLKDGVSLEKCVSLGISVCLPQDTYNEELGKKIAHGKAIKYDDHRLYSTDAGLINTTVVDALLRQEAEYFKKNPGRYLLGYAQQEEKYRRDTKMTDYIDSLDNEGSKVLHYLAEMDDEDVDDFIDAVNYLRD